MDKDFKPPEPAKAASDRKCAIAHCNLLIITLTIESHFFEEMDSSYSFTDQSYHRNDNKFKSIKWKSFI